MLSLSLHQAFCLCLPRAENTDVTMSPCLACVTDPPYPFDDSFPVSFPVLFPSHVCRNIGASMTSNDSRLDPKEPVSHGWLLLASAASGLFCFTSPTLLLSPSPILSPYPELCSVAYNQPSHCNQRIQPPSGRSHIRNSPFHALLE